MTEQNVTADVAQVETLTTQSSATGRNLATDGPVNGSHTPQHTYLAIIINRLTTYFTDRARHEDAEILHFSLQHIFICIDTLYSATLLSIHEYTLNTNSQFDRDNHHLVQQRNIWIQLHEIKRILERMEPLGQLLNGTINAMLHTLEPLTDTGDWQTILENSAALSQQLSVPSDTDQEQWEQAVTTLSHHLEKWQQCYAQQRSFSQQFADITLTLPSLARIDAAFDGILENTKAIFNDILLDFQAISTGDDEAVATLLLDLMQKVDLIVQNVDTLIEPLQTMIKHYSLGN